MGWFGKDKDDDGDKKERATEPGAVPVVPVVEAEHEDLDVEIPLITDAVIVAAEEPQSNHRHQQEQLHSAKGANPPTKNPNHQNVQMTSSLQQPANTSTMVPYQQPGNLVRPTPIFNLGRNPVGLQCPYCQRQTITIVQDRLGMGTFVAVILLALFFWPLCWLPFCIPSCKATYHYCGHPNCRRKISETGVCS